MVGFDEKHSSHCLHHMHSASCNRLPEGAEESLLSYVLYVTSAISLVGTVWVLVPLIARIRLKTPQQSTMLKLSLSFSLAYGVFKLALGLYIPSSWLILMALYYFALSFTRFHIVRHYTDGWTLCSSVGFRLLILNLFASAIISFVVVTSHTISYPEFAIYAIAAWTFYLVISSTVSTVKSWKRKQPSLVSASATKLSGALVSLFILQNAMITTFGDDPTFRKTMGSILGFSVVVLILFFAIVLIVGGKRMLDGKALQNGMQ